MRANKNTIHVIQGEYHVSDRAQDELSTVLGSCVAACIFDPVRKIGGMNHFLLPGSDPKCGRNIKYGAHSMEMLINAMLRRGARRELLEAQLFGGGNVISGLSRIGASNAAFAREFVQNERLRLTRQDLGGKTGRRLRFDPTTGRAQIAAFNIGDRDPALTAKAPPPRAAVGGSVDLF